MSAGYTIKVEVHVPLVARGVALCEALRSVETWASDVRQQGRSVHYTMTIPAINEITGQPIEDRPYEICHDIAAFIGYYCSDERRKATADFDVAHEAYPGTFRLVCPTSY